MQSADDAIIRAWRNEVESNPNEYVLMRVGEVKSNPKFTPFNDRLQHPQIQEEMILIAAQAIADATVLIAFLPTTDEKIHGLNVLIDHFKRQKKTIWKNVEEDMDERIKKITAIDIFILMWKDLRSRLQTEADTRRPSLVDRMTQSVASKLTMPKFSFSMPKFSTPSKTRSTTEEEHEMMGGSKRRKSKKSKKSKKSIKSKKSRNSMKIRNIRRTRKSRVQRSVR